MNISKCLSTHKYFLFMLVCAAIFAWTSNSSGKVLYYDDFDDEKIDGDYEFKNHEGKWVEKGGGYQPNP